MARPRKRGLDYFPFDVDLFNDEKIVCIAGEFGAIGELVAVKLLCAVYRNGYFAEWNEAFQFKLMRDLPGVSGELLQQIVTRLVRWGFFDQSLFDSACVITSRGIQQRYFEAVRRRQQIEPDLPHLLVNAGNNPVNVNNNSVNVNINATNKSKVKEIKEKETKDTPPSIPPPREEARLGAEREADGDEVFLQQIPPAKIKRLCEALGISGDQFAYVARLVLSEWSGTDTVHSSRAASLRHLFNHIRRKLKEDPALLQRRQAEINRAVRQAERTARDEAERAYRQSVSATGRNGWQQWCESRGLDPTTTSAASLAPPPAAPISLAAPSDTATLSAPTPPRQESKAISTPDANASCQSRTTLSDIAMLKVNGQAKPRPLGAVLGRVT